MIWSIKINKNEMNARHEFSGRRRDMKIYKFTKVKNYNNNKTRHVDRPLVINLIDRRVTDGGES